MFRKTWKQLKILLAIVIILICLPRSIFPNRSGDTKENSIEYYTELNEREHRLSEYKDSRNDLEMKLAQLEIINKSRKKTNAQPVKLDILASRVANKMSRDAAENEFVGHWNLAGLKPYHRYAFAGGNDHVSENAFGEWSSDNYNNNPSVIGALMKKGHESFMSERAPNDGHKKNIIDKAHNFVGIGFHLSGKQFRYYEEFIDRYFEFENIPAEVKPGEKTSVTVKSDGRSFLYFMVVYYEKFPEPMTAKEIARKGSYNDFTPEEYLKVPAWELSKYRNGTYYHIPLKFSKEGLYYIHLFTDKKEITKPGSLTTRGKTPYSGIVIKVRQ
ncbi:MAG: CAP domain-containing protein [Methanosarcina sp.]